MFRVRAEGARTRTHIPNPESRKILVSYPELFTFFSRIRRRFQRHIMFPTQGEGGREGDTSAPLVSRSRPFAFGSTCTPSLVHPYINLLNVVGSPYMEIVYK